MSVIETFYILFKANTSDVKKGTEEAKKTTDNLNESLRGTANVGERVGEVFFSVADSFLKIASSALSVYTIIDGLKRASDYTSSLDLASRTLGVNIEQLDEWGNALRMTGGDAKSFQAVLQSLSQHTGAPPAIALQFLSSIGETLRRLPQVQAFQFGQSLGLDAPTILLLRQYGAGINELLQHQKDLGVITEKDRQVQNNFNKSLFDTQHIFRTIFVELDSKLLPVFTKLFHLIQPGLLFLEKHMGIVSAALVGLLAGVAVELAALAAPFLEIPIIFGAIGLAFGLLSQGIQSIIPKLKEFGERWSFIADIIKLDGEIINAVVYTNTEAFKLLGAVGRSAFSGIVDTLKLLRDELYALLDGIQKLYEFFHVNQNVKLVAGLAKQELEFIARSPINAQTASSIFSSHSSNNAPTTVTTGDITVNTQANDAVTLWRDLKAVLFREHTQATSMFDNGIAK